MYKNEIDKAVTKSLKMAETHIKTLEKEMDSIAEAMGQRRGWFTLVLLVL